MKSPITGKDMIAKVEPLVHEYRKENVEILYHYFLCEDSGERFEDELFMELNLNQVYNSYQIRHNLPFTDRVL